MELPSFIRFGRATCGALAEGERREWWLSNGRGAYAAGTIAGSLTRRYHGLLVASFQPPLHRFLFCAKADATLMDGERECPLFTNRWSDGAVEPDGHVHIESFHLEGRMPVWRFALGDLTIEQRIWMEPGANTTYVGYRLAAGDPGRHPGLRLRVAVLVDARDHDWVSRVGDISPQVSTAGGRLLVRHSGRFDLQVRAPDGTWTSDATWEERFGLAAERERGLEDVDNHLRVGLTEIPLEGERWTGLVVSVEAAVDTALDVALGRRLAYDTGLLRQAAEAVPELADGPEWVRQLVLAADTFLFTRASPGEEQGMSVIAGYPWFGEWGRDTMIALAGLTLATGRHENARRILETFGRLLDRGMLPNMFPSSLDGPRYNTVDAALWYVEAWRAYLEVSGDREALARAFPVLADIVRWYRDGTRYGVRMDPLDGLIEAGSPGIQLTWMDAKVGDWVVTPRSGKPVEVNALWYNALRVLADLAAALGEDPVPFRGLADRAREGFRRYLRPDGQGLLDVLDGPEGDDFSVRPNQILAVSLPHSPLDKATQAAVVAACGRELLCSYGLRSLAPGSPGYRARYQGGVWERDGAYHQGTVWAWLLGHYAMAEYRVSGDAAAAQARLAPLADHLADAGLGTVSEIFDAGPPHVPRGAPSQAWSVACTLEAWWRLERARRTNTLYVAAPLQRTGAGTPPAWS
jgi:predicted glycogen debranching enzyme